METNYHEVVKMTKEEQREMYKNVPLEKLIEMLIECNRLLAMYTTFIVAYPTEESCHNCSNQCFNETMDCKNYYEDFRCRNFAQKL